MTLLAGAAAGVSQTQAKTTGYQTKGLIARLKIGFRKDSVEEGWEVDDMGQHEQRVTRTRRRVGAQPGRQAETNRWGPTEQ